MGFGASRFNGRGEFFKKMKKTAPLLVVLALVVIAGLPSLVEAACPAGQFSSVFNNTCYSDYQTWVKDVWSWSMKIIIPLSVLILTAAGVIYMTSEGDSNRVGLAKKMIIGVASGVGILVLGRLLLQVIIGDPSAGGWVF